MKKYATKDIVSTKRKLSSMYMGREIVRMRICGIHPEFKVEWIVAALVDSLQEDYSIVNTSVTQVIC